MEFTTLLFKSIVKSITCQLDEYLKLAIFLFLKIQSFLTNIVNSLNLSSFIFLSQLQIGSSQIFPLAKTTKVLNHSISVLIPSKDCRGIEFNNKNMVIELSSLFVRLFGGLTIFPCVGVWPSESGQEIQEDILEIKSFASREGLACKLQEVMSIVLNLKIKYSQERIAIIVDGCLYLI